MPANHTGKAAKAKICPECGVSFETTHPTKTFCCAEHKQAFANRLTARGKVLASHVLTWRMKRGAGGLGKRAFAELCKIADLFNAEDREAGRLPMSAYEANLLASPYDYQDRQTWQAKAAWRHRSDLPASEPAGAA